MISFKLKYSITIALDVVFVDLPRLSRANFFCGPCIPQASEADWRIVGSYQLAFLLRNPGERPASNFVSNYLTFDAVADKTTWSWRVEYLILEASLLVQLLTSF